MNLCARTGLISVYARGRQKNMIRKSALARASSEKKHGKAYQSARQSEIWVRLCCCPLTNRCRLLSEEIAAAKRSLLLVHVFSAEPELSKPPEREDLISACRCFIARPVKVDYFPRLARPRNVGRLGRSEPEMTIILIDYFLRKQFRRCCWRYRTSGGRDSHDEKNPGSVRHPIGLFRCRFSRNGCRDNATLCMSYWTYGELQCE